MATVPGTRVKGAQTRRIIVESERLDSRKQAVIDVAAVETATASDFATLAGMSRLPFRHGYGNPRSAGKTAASL